LRSLCEKADVADLTFSISKLSSLGAELGCDVAGWRRGT
jgi:hypothetical protein